MGTEANHKESKSGATPAMAPVKRWRRTVACIVLIFLGASLGLLSLLPRPPVLLWNHSASLPVGLYGVEQIKAVRGDYVAVLPTGYLRATLDAYGALPDGRLLLKQLAASAGDTVCRDHAAVSVNGVVLALAKKTASDGGMLPAWTGCRTLGAEAVLVLTQHAGSFDSRYFGPIGADQIVGVAHPLITFTAPQETP